jgi:hypothetical protein
MCGASPVFNGELLNLRSSDRGATWSVTDTRFGFTPHHAGDTISVTLSNPTNGQVHVVSFLGGFDVLYGTSDGGLTWRVVAAHQTTCTDLAAAGLPCPKG